MSTNPGRSVNCRGRVDAVTSRQLPAWAGHVTGPGLHRGSPLSPRCCKPKCRRSVAAGEEEGKPAAGASEVSRLKSSQMAAARDTGGMAEDDTSYAVQSRTISRGVGGEEQEVRNHLWKGVSSRRRRCRRTHLGERSERRPRTAQPGLDAAGINALPIPQEGQSKARSEAIKPG